MFYPNGKVMATSIFKNGKLNGISKMYYDNGKIKVQGALKNYKAYGNWNFYNKDGYLTDTQGFY